MNYLHPSLSGLKQHVYLGIVKDVPTTLNGKLLLAGLKLRQVCYVFTDYQQRISQNTQRRQAGDLALFAHYLSDAGISISVSDLLSLLSAWHGITSGLVDGFVRWMLKEGYAIGSLNVRLSTIKKYAALATWAGTLSSTTML